MIEQTGGLNSTIQSERLYRENSTTGTDTQQPSREQEVAQESRVTDTVSLSAEALSRPRNVPQAGAASELQESSASETSSEDAQEQQRAGTIDIRV